MTENTEYWTEERCFITEHVNDPSHPGASLATARVTPGTLTERHSLAVHEWYVIQSGQGDMFLGDDPPFEVKPGHIVSIAPGVAQQIRNTGDADLVFQCLCQPRFRPESYRSLEPTT